MPRLVRAAKRVWCFESDFSCHSSLIAVSGNSRKFDAKINLGAGFAPTQIAYQQKAKALESLKMETRGLCKQCTKSYEPANTSVPASLSRGLMVSHSDVQSLAVPHGDSP